jgi:CheY-like chemotaxis protein
MSEPRIDKPEAAKSGVAVIYVVDDEPMLLELASVILEPLGYRIETFRDPAVALQAFTSAQPKPALIITDYAMHTMNGLKLIEECRHIQPKQKTLLLSGTVGPDSYDSARTRPDAFLAKPYQAKQLVDAVKSILAT